jgi:hypothetical protein
MHGEGNSKTADPYTEYRYLANMIAALRTWCSTTLPASVPAGVLTVDPLWSVVVGLSAYRHFVGGFSGGAVELGMVRRMQREATWYKDYAWWADSQHLPRTDGTHMSASDAAELKSRQLWAMRNHRNVPSPTTQYGYT